MDVELPFDLAYLPQNKRLGFRQRKRKLTKIYLQKAQAAIAELSKQGKIKVLDASIYEENREFVRFLSRDDFSWIEEPDANCVKIYLNCKLNSSSWTIAASTNSNWDEPDKFSIDVYPSCGYDDWVLGTNSVKLCAKQLDTQVFTSLWKAFETRCATKFAQRKIPLYAARRYKLI